MSPNYFSCIVPGPLIFRADMEIDLQMCLWRLACQVVGAGQDIANLLTKQNHHQQASQVSPAATAIPYLSSVTV